MRRTLPKTVRHEFVRALRAPYETPIVVAVNGLLMTVLWFVFPSNLLFTFHGALAFPMVLASWMYSDVPATNVLGTDATSSLAALSDMRAMRRLLHARTLVLWIFVAPFCVLVGIVVSFNDKHPLAAAATAVWIAIVPFGALPLAGWLGIYFPYHPMPLKRRWELRYRWRTIIVRWLSLAMIPYGLVRLARGAGQRTDPDLLGERLAGLADRTNPERFVRLGRADGLLHQRAGLVVRLHLGRADRASSQETAGRVPVEPGRRLIQPGSTTCRRIHRLARCLLHVRAICPQIDPRHSTFGRWTGN